MACDVDDELEQESIEDYFHDYVDHDGDELVAIRGRGHNTQREFLLSKGLVNEWVPNKLVPSNIKKVFREMVKKRRKQKRMTIPVVADHNLENYWSLNIAVDVETYRSIPWVL
eukprot:Awhi_evm1s8944